MARPHIKNDIQKGKYFSNMLHNNILGYAWEQGSLRLFDSYQNQNQNQHQNQLYSPSKYAQTDLGFIDKSWKAPS